MSCVPIAVDLLEGSMILGLTNEPRQMQLQTLFLDYHTIRMCLEQQMFLMHMTM
jgi:hypothetical protein